MAIKPEPISKGPLIKNCQMKRNAINRPQRSRPYDSSKYKYEPPDPGSVAPSSLQIRPSTIISAPAPNQPRMAYGPGRIFSISGMVTKTPAPTIIVTLSAVACHKPKCRMSSGEACGPEEEVGVM